MKVKNTKRFGLLLIGEFGSLKTDLTKHYRLKTVWESVKECADEKSALKFAEEYLSENDYWLIIVTDIDLSFSFLPNSSVTIVKTRSNNEDTLEAVFNAIFNAIEKRVFFLQEREPTICI